MTGLRFSWMWDMNILGMWHNQATQFSILVPLGQYNTVLLVLKYPYWGVPKITKICHQMRAEATKWLGPNFKHSPGGACLRTPLEWGYLYWSTLMTNQTHSFVHLRLINGKSKYKNITNQYVIIHGIDFA